MGEEEEEERLEEGEMEWAPPTLSSQLRPLLFIPLMITC
jgi:hypothetical protein